MKRKIILLFFLISCSYSCIHIYKTIIGFKNPTVYNNKELIKESEKIFGKDSIYDIYLSSIKDSTDIDNLLALSSNGNLNIYNKKNMRLCIPTNSCIADQLPYIFSNSIDSIPLCNFQNDLKKVDYRDLRNSNKIYLSNIVTSDYYILFYWSTFLNKYKTTREEFKFLLEELNKSEKKIQIIRVNCDLNDSWGLKKGEKLKLKFEKDTANYYNIKLGKIPWKDKNSTI
ncbi:MAG: hypothetical protein PHW92_14190 [Lutibacter sp.]|nr:hypothetical protein [Lutibacter sp.]